MVQYNWMLPPRSPIFTLAKGFVMEKLPRRSRWISPEGLPPLCRIENSLTGLRTLAMRDGQVILSLEAISTICQTMKAATAELERSGMAV